LSAFLGLLFADGFDAAGFDADRLASLLLSISMASALRFRDGCCRCGFLGTGGCGAGWGGCCLLLLFAEWLFLGPTTSRGGGGGGGGIGGRITCC
jgi:hypothetical protein